MIKRIVKLTFRRDAVDTFKELFEVTQKRIKAFPGCQHVELLHAKNNTQIFFTFSLWDDEESLERYRHSELFKTTWAKTKTLFDGRPEAWSTEQVG